MPLILNLTGSVWFFVLVGQAGECAAWMLNLGFSRDGGDVKSVERERLLKRKMRAVYFRGLRCKKTAKLLSNFRIESHRPNYQLSCFSVYCTRGVVGGREDYIPRLIYPFLISSLRQKWFQSFVSY